VFYLSCEPRLPFHPPSLPPFFSTLAIPSTTALSFLSTARLSYVTCSYPSLPPYLGNPPPSLPPSLPPFLPWQSPPLPPCLSFPLPVSITSRALRRYRRGGAPRPEPPREGREGGKRGAREGGISEYMLCRVKREERLNEKKD